MNEPALTNGHGPQVGQPCPRETCDGVLVVKNTIVRADVNRRHQYLGCNKCGSRPLNNLRIVPLQYAPPRKRRA